jgi:hypothetical protein
MKTKFIFLRLAIIFIFFLAGFNIYSQSENDTLNYFIKTKDANNFIGKILEQDSMKVIILTETFGKMQIFRVNIQTMEIIKSERMIDGNYWFENPQATRYFYSPNGFGLKSGEGYYQNIWVLFNSFSVGVSDNFSLGGGTIPAIIFGAGVMPVWITPKFSIPTANENLNFGAGALMGTVLGEKNTGFGIVYGLTTFGTRDNNVSFGLGYGYAGGSWAKTPLINFGGLFRTGPKGYFVTENYFIQIADETVVLLSLGRRSIINRVGLDYGLFVPFSSGIDGFFAFPWLGLTVPF